MRIPTVSSKHLVAVGHSFQKTQWANRTFRAPRMYTRAHNAQSGAFIYASLLLALVLLVQVMVDDDSTLCQSCFSWLCFVRIAFNRLKVVRDAFNLIIMFRQATQAIERKIWTARTHTQKLETFLRFCCWIFFFAVVAKNRFVARGKRTIQSSNFSHRWKSLFI